MPFPQDRTTVFCMDALQLYLQRLVVRTPVPFDATCNLTLFGILPLEIDRFAASRRITESKYA